MSAFTADQLDAFRQRLVERLEEFDELKDVQDDVSDTVSLGKSTTGRFVKQSQAMATATAERRAVLQRNAKNAIKRLDDGSFGECVQCSGPINPERIEHNPAASLCMVCAEKAEEE